MSMYISKTIKFGQLCTLFEKIQKAKGMFIFFLHEVIVILHFLLNFLKHTHLFKLKLQKTNKIKFMEISFSL